MAGPNLAREVLDGFAAAAVVATPDDSVAQALQPLFRTTNFRVYRNLDLLGSELGGVLKNIIAIASGMADGLGVGDNTRALVITRGLAEMTRLGEAMGADARTFAGLTGMGDLMATCMSPLSRNRRVGEELARGRTLEEVLAEMGQVAEGVKTARPVMQLAEEHDVFMPIAAEVDAVVNEGRHAARGLPRPAARDAAERAPRGGVMATTAPPAEPVLRAGDKPLDWGREREMNALEALMWRAEEDPRLRSTICGVEELDTRAGLGPVPRRARLGDAAGAALPPAGRRAARRDRRAGVGDRSGLRPALPRAPRAAARRRRAGRSCWRRPSRSR